MQSFDSYSEPSHHDVHIRWWSAYSLYGCSLNATNTEKAKCLRRGFQILTYQDSSGLPVNSFSCKNVPIITNTDCLDKDFIEPEFLICLNYPNLKVIPSDFSENNAFVVGGLISQLSQASQDPFEDMA